MEKVHFYKMQICDLDVVMAIEVANYPVAWSQGVMKDCIKEGYHCIVLKQSDTIIGYAFLMVNRDESHLLNMCIDKKSQGQGLGRKLLKYLESICQYNQSKKFLLEVRKSNPVAYTLYKSFGFKKIGVRKNYYRTLTGREHAIVMTKPLQG